ncbi:unnamed protein product [Phytophthora fragariaefolia]|uniref:Unnamed protein product n=1 Tax=Phytophthora fragariaefolia TaxID=1490495 RepID=A0A9W6YJ95_9STRA|nr:unnamed protein product [Phytophthora fragariaefolia]
MASKNFQTTRRPDETPLEYLYRLNVGAIRAKIRYEDGTKEEKREHVELFINTLGSQEVELASRLTLMKVPDVETLEKKLRTLQRALTQQKKAHFMLSGFRQKTATPAPPTRAVHMIQAATSDSDVEREKRDIDYDQAYDPNRVEDEHAEYFMQGHTAPPEAVALGQCRPRYRHYRANRRARGADTREAWVVLEGKFR